VLDDFFALRAIGSGAVRLAGVFAAADFAEVLRAVLSAAGFLRAALVRPALVRPTFLFLALFLALFVGFEDPAFFALFARRVPGDAFRAVDLFGDFDALEAFRAPFFFAAFAVDFFAILRVPPSVGRPGPA
jgi:hypothetical protein